MEISVDELLEKMRRYYNGFCFDGIQTVYSPFSVLNFLKSYEFANYWMDSANPKIILVYINIMRHRSDGGDWDISAPFMKALMDGNCDLMIKMLNHLLASIPYEDYAKAAQQAVMLSDLPVQEWLYRSTILAFLRGCGVLTLGEMHTNKGRSDLLLLHKGAAWVVEIKVAYNDDGKVLAQEALDQITAKQYDAPFLAAKKVGIAIDDKARQIKEWVGRGVAVNGLKSQNL